MNVTVYTMHTHTIPMCNDNHVYIIHLCTQGSFTFVLIPVGKAPLQEVTKSKKGGLNNDELQKYSKSYYASNQDSQVQKEVLNH